MRATCCLIRRLLSHWTWTKPFSLFPTPSGIGLFNQTQTKPDLFFSSSVCGKWRATSSLNPILHALIYSYRLERERETEKTRGGRDQWVVRRCDLTVKLRVAWRETDAGREDERFGAESVATSGAAGKSQWRSVTRWGNTGWDEEAVSCFSEDRKDMSHWIQRIQKVTWPHLNSLCKSVLPALTRTSPSLQWQEKMTGPKTTADSSSCSALFLCILLQFCCHRW